MAAGAAAVPKTLKIGRVPDGSNGIAPGGRALKNWWDFSTSLAANTTITEVKFNINTGESAVVQFMLGFPSYPDMVYRAVSPVFTYTAGAARVITESVSLTGLAGDVIGIHYQTEKSFNNNASGSGTTYYDYNNAHPVVLTTAVLEWVDSVASPIALGGYA